jgi:hypothetical protein
MGSKIKNNQLMLLVGMAMFGLGLRLGSGKYSNYIASIGYSNYEGIINIILPIPGLVLMLSYAIKILIYYNNKSD